MDGPVAGRARSATSAAAIRCRKAKGFAVVSLQLHACRCSMPVVCFSPSSCICMQAGGGAGNNPRRPASSNQGTTTVIRQRTIRKCNSGRDNELPALVISQVSNQQLPAGSRRRQCCCRTRWAYLEPLGWCNWRLVTQPILGGSGMWKCRTKRKEGWGAVADRN
jgi:hypothetical protein